MDLVAGPDLAMIGGRRIIAVDEAIRAMEACDARAWARAGDRPLRLKPANLLLDECGGSGHGLRPPRCSREMPGREVEGTVLFMAPEQASRCWGPIDARTSTASGRSSSHS
ncbi:MAG: hypothetical protein WKF75_21675 [Singulisphaera sp.]